MPSAINTNKPQLELYQLGQRDILPYLHVEDNSLRANDFVGERDDLDVSCRMAHN